MNEKLEKLILDRVGSKSAFAELIGVYPQNVNKMSNPPLDTFARIVNVLDIRGHEVIEFGKMLTGEGQLNNTRLAVDLLEKSGINGQRILEVLNAYIE